MITTLFHPNMKRFIFVDQLEPTKIDAKIVDKLGNTLSRHILEDITIEAYIELKQKEGWNVEYHSGLNYFKHNNNNDNIHKQDFVTLELVTKSHTTIRTVGRH